VIAAMTDDEVEAAVAAAGIERPEPTTRGYTEPLRQRSSSVAPRGNPRAGEPDVAWMDMDREIGRIHAAIVRLNGFIPTHPEAMASRADRIGREAELLRMLSEAASGMTTADLETALAAWAEGGAA